jgi:thermostable 8-oxoguanine DNA glycosylase
VLLDRGQLTTLDLVEIGDLVDREATHLLRSAGVLDFVLDRHRNG